MEISLRKVLGFRFVTLLKINTLTDIFVRVLTISVDQLLCITYFFMEILYMTASRTQFMNTQVYYFL